MKFPVTIRHRSSKAKIYAPGGKFVYCRIAYSTAGKRRMQTFANYSAAREAAAKLNGCTMGEAVEGYLRTVKA